MTPREFFEKAEQGILTNDEIVTYLRTVSQALMDLKQTDPGTYLQTVLALTEAMNAAREALAPV